MLVDGEFYRFVTFLLSTAFSENQDAAAGWANVQRWYGNARSLGIGGLALLAILSTVGILASQFVRLVDFRNIKSLLAATTLAAYWLGVGLQSQAIVEFGREHRLRLHADKLTEFLLRVDSEWQDVVGATAGETDGIALQPHTAYPLDQPTMVMFLGKQQIPGTNLAITGMERTQQEAVRIELADSNRGFWIEYRLDQSPPRSFTGGLGERFSMRQYAELRPSLYLVSYNIDHH
jgi:hypothetical protein